MLSKVNILNFSTLNLI